MHVIGQTACNYFENRGKIFSMFSPVHSKHDQFHLQDNLAHFMKQSLCRIMVMSVSNNGTLHVKLSIYACIVS